MTETTQLTQRPAFAQLTRHYEETKNGHLRELFASDPGRAERFCAEGAGVYLDYSKNRITETTMGMLFDLARQCGLEERRDAMFEGRHVNISEDRAVLHVALRMPRNTALVVDGDDVVGEVHSVLDAMATFCDEVRSGAWLGHTGKAIRNVVNIGIGGSDLGPVMAY
ncbi:MAG: glucose-6-phosphate isomerase, partial [Steroidobacteraceae bacterium]